MTFAGAALSGTGGCCFARKTAAIWPIDGSSVAAGGTLKTGVRPRHGTGFAPASGKFAVATTELAIASAASAELAVASASRAAKVAGAASAELSAAAATSTAEVAGATSSSAEAAACPAAASTSPSEPSSSVGIRSYEEQCGKHSRSRQHSYGQSHGLIPFSKDAVHTKKVISNW
jgi:hypothetical protein